MRRWKKGAMTGLLSFALRSALCHRHLALNSPRREKRRRSRIHLEHGCSCPGRGDDEQCGWYGMLAASHFSVQAQLVSAEGDARTRRLARCCPRQPGPGRGEGTGRSWGPDWRSGLAGKFCRVGRSAGTGESRRHWCTDPTPALCAGSCCPLRSGVRSASAVQQCGVGLAGAVAGKYA